CIGVDPYYLTHKAQILGYIPQVILAGRSINDGMGTYIASQVIKHLIHLGGSVKGSTVTVLGFTFKENVPDLRNTRVIDIVTELRDYAVHVQVTDPLADPAEARREYGIDLLPDEALAPADAVVLAVPHRGYVTKGWQAVVPLLRDGGGVVVDVKARLPREHCPPGVRLWRL
ncbi:MAG: UDP binding domain-containing protein, partial [Gammaproteobacteria bacterium]